MHYLLAALAGGFLFFNSQATPDKVAGRIETTLRRQYPGARVDVDVKGRRGLNVLRGNFREVRLSMSNFKAATAPPAGITQNAKKKGHVGRALVQLRDFDFNGIRIELAELEMGDVVYDLDALKSKSQLQIASVGPGRAHLIIPAASLQALVKERVKDVKDARLSLQDGQLRLTGTRAVPIIGDVPFGLTARPEIRNGSEIWLADAIVTLNGQAVPDVLTKTIVGPMNPVFSFGGDNKAGFRILLRNLVARKDKIEISGDVSFPGLNATTPQITTPQITTPQVTTPQITTPQVTTPQVTTPMNTPQANAPMNTPQAGAPVPAN